jgi:hypothetical protein
MGVSEGEFKKVYVDNFTAIVAGRNAYKEIKAIIITLRGKLGGRSPQKNREVNYKVYINVDNIRSDQIPHVFFLEPSEDLIQHVNIFHPARCEDLGKNLPHLCWGEYDHYWAGLAAHNRTLMALLRCAESILKSQNLKSPAR